MSLAVDDAQSARRPVEVYGELIGGHDGAVGRSHDELLESGAVRPGSLDLAATTDLLGVPGLLARRAEVVRALEDDGVTYGGPAEAGKPGGPRRWLLDPLPVVVESDPWAGLARGLTQRAELLDAVLADLYGPRDLLRHGLLPAEAVLGHSGFVRQADGVRLPGPHQLFLAAADLARDADGRWTVLGDRTQAPSGAGYAMENRRVISRVMPGLYRDTRLARLRAFFHVVRAALQEVAPATAEVPRVVLLTPGAASETAFDQSFLATLLGYPLVTGEDLTVREGRVHLRAMGRLEPVDVILRRVDAEFCDPLELRPDSRLGVPGLLEAARLGTVSVVNTIGSGVLENPALLPYLPKLCRALFDEDLLLPSAPTWWCGEAAGRSHALANLDRLILKPIAREPGGTAAASGRFGWELSARGRDELRRRIEAAPWAWAAQEPLAMSTAPVVTGRGLEPRHLVLRSFAVAQGGRYQLMAGGLARVAGQAGSRLVSNMAGALAKDVWVQAPAHVPALVQSQLAPEPFEPPSVLVAPTALPPRVAEDLFWLGRYAERAEDAVRLLRVVDDLAEDHASNPDSPGGQCLRIMLRTLTAVTTTWPGFVGDGAGARLAAPRAELVSLTVDADRTGSLANAVRRTVEAAHAVREQLSLDTWIVLGSLDRVLAELAAKADEAADPALAPTLGRVLEGLLAMAGLGAESLIRDAGWYFMDTGRRLERALQLVALLRHALGQPAQPGVEALVLESVLVAGESVITHRRRHLGRPQPSTVLDLLVLERSNPRSLTHQLDRLADDLRYLPREPNQGFTLNARLRDITARLREADAAGLVRGHVASGRQPDLARLVPVLDELSAELAGLAGMLEELYFAHPAPLRPLAATPGWDTVAWEPRTESAEQPT